MIVLNLLVKWRDLDEVSPYSLAETPLLPLLLLLQNGDQGDGGGHHVLVLLLLVLDSVGLHRSVQDVAVLEWAA